MSCTVVVTVNGKRMEVPLGLSLADLISEVGTDKRGIAVAINQEVVPRSLWEHTIISNEDRVEIITAAPGG